MPPLPDLALPEPARRQRLAHASLGRARRDWYRVQAAAPASDETEIDIYDAIGGWLGLAAADFLRDLRAITTPKITVRLNSPGGDVFDGIAIYTALREHPAAVTVRVDSLAASIASVIALAGDRVVMARHATLMIHEPFSLVIGDAADMRKQADVLDQLGDEIAAVYAERAGGSTREWRDRMREETWYTDRGAVDAGLADAVAGDPPAEPARNTFDLSLFRHPPADLLGPPPDDGADGPPTTRTIERALRDAGLSQSQAKALIAAGRDVLDRAPRDQTRDVSELLRLSEGLRALTHPV